MRDDDRPLNVMIVQPTFDPDLPLSLAERLRTAMTVHSLPHGARALELIEAGASPDIILLDRRAAGVDVAAMRRVLELRTRGVATAISYIDADRAVIHDAATHDPLALVHGLHTALPPTEARDRLHDDEAGERSEDD